MVHKVRPVLMVLMEPSDPQVLKAPRVPPAQPVLTGRMVLMVPLDRWGRPALQVRKVFKGLMACPDQADPRGLRDQLVLKDLSDRRVLQVLQASMDHQARKVRLASRASLDRQVHRALTV